MAVRNAAAYGEFRDFSEPRAANESLIEGGFVQGGSSSLLIVVMRDNISVKARRVLCLTLFGTTDQETDRAEEIETFRRRMRFGPGCACAKN